MAVYVDDAYIPATVPNGQQAHTSQWCHLTADSTEELVAFAKSIGLRRTWIQLPATAQEHFDLTLGKRAQAVANGALEINRDEAAALIRAKAHNEPFNLHDLRVGCSRADRDAAPTKEGSDGSWHTLTLW